jgi:hypothetical protein
MPYQSQVNGKAATSLSRIYLTGTILLNIVPQQQLQPKGKPQPINKCNNKKNQHLGWPSITTSQDQSCVDLNKLSAILVRTNGKEQYQPEKTQNQKPQ